MALGNDTLPPSLTWRKPVSLAEDLIETRLQETEASHNLERSHP